MAIGTCETVGLRETLLRGLLGGCQCQALGGSRKKSHILASWSCLAAKMAAPSDSYDGRLLWPSITARDQSVIWDRSLWLSIMARDQSVV